MRMGKIASPEISDTIEVMENATNCLARLSDALKDAGISISQESKKLSGLRESLYDLEDDLSAAYSTLTGDHSAKKPTFRQWTQAILRSVSEIHSILDPYYQGSP